jgi:hypothetical protein
MVVIAHRQSTLDVCDRVVRLDDGALADLRDEDHEGDRASRTRSGSWPVREA